MGRFRNKVVIVTGASSGIGEATALDFAKQGARLCVCGRNKERLIDSAKKCREAGAEVHEFIGDLAEFDNLELLINETVAKYGDIDILINNAGAGDFKPIDQMGVDAYDKMFMANVRAPVFLSKYALPHLKKSKGCIVNVSSCSSLMASPHSVAYSMTKAALDHFTRGFSSECSGFGVRVNSVNPAVVATRFAAQLGIPEEQLQQVYEALKKAQPLGLLTPEHVSESILYLCSSEMTTGITLPIDAGLIHSRKV